MTQLFQGVINWYMLNINYFTIVLLMAIEGSFIPFPSEVVIPPAAWKAAQGEMNLFLIIFFGTLGALIGSLINYYLGYYLGRKLIYKFADSRFAGFLLIDANKVRQAEEYFVKHGKSSTFIGRLVPGVRQLISIPAGLAKMPLKDFLIYTIAGAALWNSVLAALGYFLFSKKEILELYYDELTYGMLALGVLFILYLVYSGMKKKNRK